MKIESIFIMQVKFNCKLVISLNIKDLRIDRIEFLYMYGVKKLAKSMGETKIALNDYFYCSNLFLI